MTQNHVCDGHCGKTCGCTHFDGDDCPARGGQRLRLHPSSEYANSWDECNVHDWQRIAAAIAEGRKSAAIDTALSCTAGPALERCRADFAALSQRLAEAVALLKRLSEWDHMDTAGDGPFWRKEIAAFLRSSPGSEKGEP